MLLSDYYMAEKLKEHKAKYRFDIIKSTMEYDPFQLQLVNKRKPNLEGWSINFVPRPSKWGGEESPDRALTKGSQNISSIIFPEPGLPFGYGDVKGTDDALLLILNNDFLSKGINSFEILIARGHKHNKKNLWFELVDGELDHEILKLKESSVEIQFTL